MNVLERNDLEKFHCFLGGGRESKTARGREKSKSLVLNFHFFHAMNGKMRCENSQRKRLSSGFSHLIKFSSEK